MYMLSGKIGEKIVYNHQDAKINLINKINTITDRKGSLSISWSEIPTIEDLYFIKKSWKLMHCADFAAVVSCADCPFFFEILDGCLKNSFHVHPHGRERAAQS